MTDTPDDDNDQNDDIQQVKHQQLSARVPDHIGPGVFSTGALVICGNNEFVMDFVLRMMQPHQVVARVVVPHRVMGQVINALTNNLEKYRNRFGEPPSLKALTDQANQESPPVETGEAEPAPAAAPAQKPGDIPEGVPGGGLPLGAEESQEDQENEAPTEPGSPVSPRPRIEDVYDELKLPDRMLAGAYANAVMISHSAAEFNFDFLANFYPRSAVSARILMSAPHVPPLLDSLNNTWKHFQQRVEEQQRKKREDEGDDGMYPPQ